MLDPREQRTLVKELVRQLFVIHMRALEAQLESVRGGVGTGQVSSLLEQIVNHTSEAWLNGRKLEEGTQGSDPIDGPPANASDMRSRLLGGISHLRRTIVNVNHLSATARDQLTGQVDYRIWKQVQAYSSPENGAMFERDPLSLSLRRLFTDSQEFLCQTDYLLAGLMEDDFVTTACSPPAGHCR